MSIYSYNDLSYVVVDSSYISIVGGNPIGTLTIPSDISHVGILYPVQEISSNAFQDVTNITALDASNSNLITIGNFAFHRTTSLTTVDLRNSKVTTIGNSALSETNSLHTIYFPETLETLGLESCAYNDLSSVIFPNNCNLTDISNQAFGANDNLTLMDFTNCIKISTIGAQVLEPYTTSSLTSITFGGMAPSIDSNAFASINSSANIYVNWWTDFSSSYGTWPVVPVVKMYNDISFEIIDASNVSIISHNSLLDSALGNTNLLNGTLTIPLEISGVSLTDISNQAFQGLSNLTLVDLSGCTDLKTIGSSAFQDCTNLTSFDCSGLTNLEIVGTNTFLNDSSINYINFRNCSSLSSIDLTGLSGVTTLPNFSFRNCTDLTSFDFYKLPALTTIGEQAFRGLSISSIDFSSNSQLKTIQYSAFSDSTMLSINFNNCISLTDISLDAFYNCNQNQSVDFSGCISLTTIENGAFHTCINNTLIDFTNCFLLSSIGEGAFTNNSKLPTIDFTDSYLLNYIGNSAFENDVSLNSITFGSKTSPTFASNVFNNIDPSANINVNWWADFSSSYGTSPVVPVVKMYNDISFEIIDASNASIISHNSLLESALGNTNLLNGTLTIPLEISGVSLTDISNQAFRGLSNLTLVDLSGCTDLKTIGSSAFRDCSNLTSFDCSGLTNLEIVGTNTFLNDSSINYINFRDCSKLSSIDLNGLTGLTTLQDYAFYNCLDLTSVDFYKLPALTTIGNYSFKYCNTTLDFSANTNIQTIGQNAFENNPSTSLNFNSCTSLIDISNRAFLNCFSIQNIDFSGCTSLTTIGVNTFAACFGIISIDFTNCISLTTLNDGAFSCQGGNPNLALTLIVIPSNIQQMGKNTFENCSNLRSITYLGPCPLDLNTTGISLSTTPFKNLPSDAKIYVYYEYSVTNSNNTGIGPYYLTEYQRASTIPVIIIDPPPPPPPPPPPCICPPKAILDKSHSSYKEGQNSSKIFTRINASRYSRVKKTIHVSQSNFTNICDPNIKLNININTDVQNNQEHLDNINRLNNSINCINRNRFGKFLAGLKNG